MSDHTPGPWQVRQAEEMFAIASEHGWIAAIEGDGDENVDRANARLIAAAPDLLEVLEEWLKAESVEEFVWAEDHAADAVKKARGETTEPGPWTPQHPTEGDG